MLNNQPMGFYHPSTLVKDAQRRGVRFQPIDVQRSDWDCTVEADGAIRLGLRYVNGLRQETGKAIGRQPGPRQSAVIPRPSPLSPPEGACPKCGCDDESMIEWTDRRRFCNVCSNAWVADRDRPAGRFPSLDVLIARTGLRRDEVVTLADIGALNAFGYDRRSALWQAERAIRPNPQLMAHTPAGEDDGWRGSPAHPEEPCPLPPMTEAERLIADYAGTGLTVGRHPMALRRGELAMRGVMRAIDLRAARQGRRVRVAGMVITRQRPGTAKGFVFLTLEDETGIANVIVRPDLFARDRLIIVEEPFLIVEGALQHQDGVVSVRAEAVEPMRGAGLNFEAHDFY
jgi:error-prone DNA polymerase